MDFVGPRSEQQQFRYELGRLRADIDTAWIDQLVAPLREDIEREYHLEGRVGLGRRERAALRQAIEARLAQDPACAALDARARAFKADRLLDEAVRRAEVGRARELAFEVVAPRSQSGSDKETILRIPSDGVTRLEGREVARLNFVSSMTAVFGEVGAARDHFLSVQRSSAPGSPLLAAEAASALGRASKAFEARHPGYRFASTSVACALRNRHHMRSGPGMLGHVLGLSLDYQAYDNPHLKDLDRRTLFELVGGSPTHLRFTNGSGAELGYGQRRRIIARMAEETRQGKPRSEATTRMLAQLDGAFDAMSQTSANIRTSLGGDGGQAAADEALASLERAGTLYWPRRRRIGRLRRGVARAQQRLERARVASARGSEARRQDDSRVRDAEAKVAAAETELENEVAEIRRLVDSALAPWRARVHGALEESLVAGGVDVGARIDLRTVQRAYRLVSRAKGRPSRLRQALQVAAPLLPGLEACGESAEAAEQALARLNAVAKVVLYRRVLERLDDLDFVLGSRAKARVSDPSVLQAAQRGLLRDDQMKPPGGRPGGEGERVGPAQRARPVFNREFVRAMMEHGFEPGAAWSTADSMHFDYVPGFSIFQGRTGVDYGPNGMQKR